MKKFDYYILCIDTDQYSGNFEREMCAYATGNVGECEVGRDQAEKYYTETGKDDSIDEVIEQPDDHGCCRPCAIQPTPGWTNNGHGKNTRLKKSEKIKYPAYNSVGIFLAEIPNDEILDLILERCRKFCKESVNFSRKPNNIAFEGWRIQGVKTTEETVRSGK
jgi:hypothetical protein